MQWAGDTIHDMIETREQNHHIPGATIMVIETIQVRLQDHRNLSLLLGQILVLDLLDEGERGKVPFGLLTRPLELLGMSDVLVLM